MVTAVASNIKQRPSQSDNTNRPLLVPSDSGNAPPPRRPKAREVTSRYLSLPTPSSSSSTSSSSTNTTTSSFINSAPPISSRRSRSPMLGGSRPVITTPKSLQRAVSAERRRPAAATPPSSAEKMLVTSMRSLSVSFQGESYSVPVSKVKPLPAAAGTSGGLRKVTPERRKGGVTPVSDRRERNRENSRPSDQQQQHRWPGRLRAERSSLLTRSLDYGSEGAKRSGSASVLTDLSMSVVDESSISKVVAELNLTNDNVEESRGVNELNIRWRLRDSLNSEVESVSSESSANSAIQLRGVPCGLVVPARIWQDGSNRVRKVPADPASPLSNSASNRTFGPSKLTFAKKFPNQSPVSSPRQLCSARGLSPVRGGARAASPCKALASSSAGALLRGMASPLRARSNEGNSMNDNNMCSTPSILSFAIDVRRGKFGENRIADAHELRLLHNRLLQWRLANAKVENTMFVQRHTAERSLYNAWVTTSKLRHSVTSKGIELQLLRHNLKLYAILKEQEPYLESWSLFEREHSNSVSGAIKALEASTVRLPVVCGARADVLKVQEAITSAVDVMQAMASSVCSLLMKVEQMNLLVSELSKLSAREHRLLESCKDLFSKTFIPLQVMQCSLRTQILQVEGKIRKQSPSIR